MERSTITSKELAEMIDAGAVRLLDVRTPTEFETMKIEKSENIPLDRLGEYATELSRCSGRIVLICQSGARAEKAHELLLQYGVDDLCVLDGGMKGWVSNGQATLRGRETMSIERQVRITAGSIAFIGALLSLAVNSWFALIPLFIGAGLTFAGLTNTCMMGTMLAKLPWNRAGCDPDRALRALLG